MSITVNTNMQALRIQQNLNGATSKMNTAMERMASGSRINKAADDAAGYAVSTTLSKTISSSKVASDNVAIGNDLLSTAEGTLNVISSNLQRVRDLTEQAANGTYSTDDLSAIAAEVSARLTEITALSDSTTFNGKSLLNGDYSNGITLQVGTTSTDTLQLKQGIFADVTAAATLSGLSGAITTGTASAISGFLSTIDGVMKGITTRITDIGAAANQLGAVADGLKVQQTNLTSALSTIKDADVAEESASYVQSQILQSASSTLLVQANSAPQIALTLIKG